MTPGILDILTWDELRVALAHELSHMGNGDILLGVAAAMATGITFVTNMPMERSRLGWLRAEPRARMAASGGSRGDVPAEICSVSHGRSGYEPLVLYSDRKVRLK